MRFLVTGGNGQLGCSLRAVAGEYPQHSFVFTDIPDLDITDPAAVDVIVSAEHVDAIINCAAYTAVDRAETDTELAEKINVEGCRVLADVCARNGVKLIHVSTDYVFDGTKTEPYTETDPTSAASVYGATKLRGEQAIEASGCDAAVVRTAWLYSEFGNNFVKTMLRLAAERDSIGVVADQRGTPTYAPDLARALVRVADNGVSGFEVYHYSNEGNISWYDFAAKIFELSGTVVAINTLTTDQYPTAAQRPAYSVLSKDKIRSIGAVTPEWEESLIVCLSRLKE